MTTLIEFLDERIADDLELATAAGGGAPRSWHICWTMSLYACDGDSRGVMDEQNRSIVAAGAWSPSTDQAMHIATWDPARVIAECQAKRRLLERHATHSACTTMRLLAWGYHSHPKYRPEWRPGGSEVDPHNGTAVGGAAHLDEARVGEDTAAADMPTLD